MPWVGPAGLCVCTRPLCQGTLLQTRASGAATAEDREDTSPVPVSAVAAEENAALAGPDIHADRCHCLCCVSGVSSLSQRALLGGDSQLARRPREQVELVASDRTCSTQRLQGK